MPTPTRRKNDIDVAVLNSKVDHLTHQVVSHMEREEGDRKEIWQEIRKLDKKLTVLFTALLVTAGGPNTIDFLNNLVI